MSLNTPDYLGVITQGQREPDAFPAVPLSGHQGRTMGSLVYKALRGVVITELDADRYGVPAEAVKTFSQAMGKHVIDQVANFLIAPGERGHLDPEHFAIHLAVRVDQLCCAYNGQKTQSPIEDQMLGALLWMQVDWSEFPDHDDTDGPDDERFQDSPNLRFQVTPQAVVAGYKVDFLLWFSMGPHKGGVAIECDGHDFHEKTKEQAARDKKRDRAILAAGYPVMRFSGSEIYNDIFGCIEQIKDVLTDSLFRVSKDGGYI